MEFARFSHYLSLILGYKPRIARYEDMQGVRSMFNSHRNLYANIVGQLSQFFRKMHLYKENT